MARQRKRFDFRRRVCELNRGPEVQGFSIKEVGEDGKDKKLGSIKVDAEGVSLALSANLVHAAIESADVEGFKVGLTKVKDIIPGMMDADKVDKYITKDDMLQLVEEMAECAGVDLKKKKDKKSEEEKPDAGRLNGAPTEAPKVPSGK